MYGRIGRKNGQMKKVEGRIKEMVKRMNVGEKKKY